MREFKMKWADQPYTGSDTGKRSRQKIPASRIPTKRPKVALKVGDLNPVVYQKVCDELNVRLYGKDYVTLAAKMKYNIDMVKKFEKSGNPTDAMLTHWKTKSKNNLNKFIKLLNGMERHDLAKLLEEAQEDLNESSSSEEC